MVLEFEYKDELAILINWLSDQLHLPSIETLVLKHFITVYNGDLEKTKKLIEKQYVLRNDYPHIFLDRDPFTEIGRMTWDAIDVVEIPGLTTDGCKILLTRLANFDINLYDFDESIKLLIMLLDTLLSIPDPDGIPKEYIAITDMTGYSFRHVTKCNFSTLRAFTKFYQEGLSIRIRNIHIINCSPVISRVMTILGPLLNSHVRNMIKYHQPDSDTLYEHLPKHMLPKDYGGQSKSVAELKSEAWDKFKGKHDYIVDKKNWKIDETKRTSAKSGWLGSWWS